MVSGINGDGNTFIYGGVKLNKDEVKSYDCVADKDGHTRYVVTFNNGTTVSYKSSENAYISSKNVKFGEGIFAQANGRKFSEQNLTSAYGVMGLELQGTKTMDQVQIDKCSIIKVDVSNDKAYDNVQIKNSEGDLSEAMLDTLKDPYGRSLGWGDVNADKKDIVSLKDNKFIHDNKEL